jgi:hypothetical protein
MNTSNRPIRPAPPLRRLALAAFAAAALVAAGAPRTVLAVDDVVQNPGNGHWYKYVDVAPAADWGTCRSAAESAGGYLATVTTMAENDWIVQALGMASRAPAWLGGSDAAVEGTWLWDGGEVWDASNWAPGEPSDVSSTENWIAMAPDGTWTDETAAQTLSGCLFEWNSDPNAIPEPTPPAAPANLVAVYATGAGVRLTWDDASADETGFVIERMPAGFAFSLRKSVDAGVTTWTDYSLFPSETYTYRVAAVNAAGVSAYSNEASITTSAAEALPAPPKTPGAFAAAPNAAPAIELTWRDESDDETMFDLERAEGGGAFRRSTTLAAGTVAFTDGAVHPGWPYAYRIRALGLQGPSAFSNPVTATVPATLGVAMQSGALRHAGAAGRDTVRLVAALTLPSPAPGETLDPRVHGLAVQYGPVGAPVVRHIAADDAGWKMKVRRGALVKATWKSPAGEWPKLTVAVDVAKGRITLSAKRADFAADPAAEMRLLVACGTRCGGATQTWTQSKPGVLQLR